MYFWSDAQMIVDYGPDNKSLMIDRIPFAAEAATSTFAASIGFFAQLQQNSMALNPQQLSQLVQQQQPIVHPQLLQQ